MLAQISGMGEDNMRNEHQNKKLVTGICRQN